MNRKTSVLMGLIALTVVSGLFAFDSINAKGTDESKTAFVSFSVSPVEYYTTVQAGENTIIEFLVTSGNDVELEISISQVDEQARSLSLESLLPSSELSVTMPNYIAFMEVGSEGSEEILTATVSTSDSLEAGTYLMEISAIDQSKGYKFAHGFQIIVVE